MGQSSNLKLPEISIIPNKENALNRFKASLDDDKQLERGACEDRFHQRVIIIPHLFIISCSYIYRIRVFLPQLPGPNKKFLD